MRVFTGSVRFALQAALLIALGACATSVPTSELPQPADGALVERWPVSVAMVLGPGVEEARDENVPDVGPQVRATFVWALRQRFEVVDAPRTNGVAGTFTVASIRPANGNLDVEVVLADPAGHEVDRWTVHGWSAHKYSATRAGLLGMDYAPAISDASAALIAGLPGRPAVRRWLASHGVDSPADAPVLPKSVVVPPRAPQGMALLAHPSEKEERKAVAARAQHCVGDRLESVIAPILDDRAVRRLLYPWLEPSVAPDSAATLVDFLGEPALRAALSAAGVRLVVLFGGGTAMDMKGGIACSNVCFGASWGTRSTSFFAVVLDLNRNSGAESMLVQRSGNVYVPAVIVPIPMIAATEGPACDELAGWIRSFASSPTD